MALNRSGSITSLVAKMMINNYTISGCPYSPQGLEKVRIKRLPRGKDDGQQLHDFRVPQQPPGPWEGQDQSPPSLQRWWSTTTRIQGVVLGKIPTPIFLHQYSYIKILTSYFFSSNFRTSLAVFKPVSEPALATKLAPTRDMAFIHVHWWKWKAQWLLSGWNRVTKAVEVMRRWSM